MSVCGPLCIVCNPLGYFKNTVGPSRDDISGIPHPFSVLGTCSKEFNDVSTFLLMC